MSTDPTTVGSPSPAKPAKRSTRTAIRQSLTFSTVGKALADVMSKDGKSSERRKSTTAATNSKEARARRASTLSVAKSTSVLASVEESPAKQVISPDARTITQSRRSSSSMRAPRPSIDETGMKLPTIMASPQQAQQQQATITRSSSVLRPRTNSTVANSALPKYRPKSFIENMPQSPACAGTRRKHSSSEEERDTTTPKMRTAPEPPSGKSNRPISPMPRRASKVSPPGLNTTPPAMLINREREKTKARASPNVTTSSPPRPKKTAKPSDSPVLKRSALPRPTPSPGSGSPHGLVHSPQTPTQVKSVAHLLVARPAGRDSPSPLRSTPVSSLRLSTMSKKDTKSERIAPHSSTDSSDTGSPGSNMEGVSFDSADADDVDDMLAAIASPSAPTPALPRIRSRTHSLHPPKTPSRPPQAQASKAKPPKPRSQPNTPAATDRLDRRPAEDRTSQAAWNKLADLSVTLEETDMGGLISEISAPFSTTPGFISPSPSTRQFTGDGPESPSPPGLPSPGDFVSISQVLLPVVTPSPAVHDLNIFDLQPDMPPIESGATVTMLKLQLASAENLAKERLEQMQRLEAQVEAMKERRVREERELAEQVSFLEEKLKETLAKGTTTPTSEYHDRCRATLEEQARLAEEQRQQAVQAAIAESVAKEELVRERLLREAEMRRRVACAARDAAGQWETVRDVVSDMHDALRNGKSTLSFLKADLDLCEARIRCRVV